MGFRAKLERLNLALSFKLVLGVRATDSSSAGAHTFNLLAYIPGFGIAVG